MEKKSTGKTVLIVILLLAVIGLSGYIVYDKFMAEDDTTKLEDQIKTLNQEIDTLKNTNTSTSSNPLTELVGNYAFEGTTTATSVDEMKENESAVIAKLEIKADGTGVYTGGMVFGDVETAKGELAISGDKIYLFNDNCKEAVVSGNECVYPNCNPIIVFNYTDGKITIAVQNDKNNTVELKKQ